MRIIAHVDMDAFFAAVEQRDNPELKGKPVIVGGQGPRGVVSTCSYEARKFKVRSAMPMAQAKKLCPHGIFLPGNMKRYQEVSREVFEVLNRFTPIVEVASVDEAFLDLTGATHFYNSLEELGEALQAEIKKETSLTASVGIAPNKFLAKLASDWRKPQGLTIIRPEEVAEFLKTLPLEKLWGVGPVTCRTLKQYGFNTAGDLASVPLERLEAILGKKTGKVLWELAQGHDPRPVEAEREAKSMGQEQTFQVDLSAAEVKAPLAQLAGKVGRRLRKEGLAASTITLKARYSDFKTVTRSRSFSTPIYDDDTIFQVAWEMLKELPTAKKYRLVGVTASNLVSKRQLSLFAEPCQDDLLATLDKLKAKYGNQVVVRGREIGG